MRPTAPTQSVLMIFTQKEPSEHQRPAGSLARALPRALPCLVCAPHGATHPHRRSLSHKTGRNNQPPRVIHGASLPFFNPPKFPPRSSPHSHVFTSPSPVQLSYLSPHSEHSPSNTTPKSSTPIPSDRAGTGPLQPPGCVYDTVIRPHLAPPTDLSHVGAPPNDHVSDLASPNADATACLAA